MAWYDAIPGIDAIAALDPTSNKNIGERIGMVGGDVVQGFTGGAYDPYSGGGWGQQLSGDPTFGSAQGGGLSDFADLGRPTQQTATQEPWGPQQEYLRQLFSESRNIYENAPDLYPGYSPYSQQYMQGLAQRSGGTPLEAQGMGTLSSLLQGDPNLRMTAAGGFLGANPYLNRQFQQGAGDITDWYNRATQGVQNQFSKAGMTGPSSFEIMRQGELQKGLGRGLSDLYTGIYAPAYESERNRQLQASGLLGSQRLGATGQVLPYSQQGIQNLNLLGQAGQMQDVLAQQRARAPWERLGLFQGGITGNYGGVTTQPGPSPLDRILGYGSQGLGAYAALA